MNSWTEIPIKRNVYEQLIRGFELHARLIISPTKTSRGSYLVIVLFLYKCIRRTRNYNHFVRLFPSIVSKSNIHT